MRRALTAASVKAEEGGERDLYQKFSIFFLDETRFKVSSTLHGMQPVFESRLVKISTQKKEIENP